MVLLGDLIYFFISANQKRSFRPAQMIRALIGVVLICSLQLYG